MLGPLRMAYVWNEGIRRESEAYEEFMNEGIKFTRSYLSSFTGFKKWLVEKRITGDCARYHAAKQALENMLEKNSSSD